MNIKPQYQQHYLRNMAIDQLADDYQAKGYQVDREKLIGDYRADLIATKGDEVIVIEVKTGKMDERMRMRLAVIGDYVRGRNNHKFLVVVASPPKKKKIDIPNLEQILLEYLVDNLPNELDELSSHTRITDVPDVTVDEVLVSDDGSIVAKGNGAVEVELQYGPSNDDGVESDDAYPFNFEIVLRNNEKGELAISHVENLSIDTSSFYE